MEARLRMKPISSSDPGLSGSRPNSWPDTSCPGTSGFPSIEVVLVWTSRHLSYLLIKGSKCHNPTLWNQVAFQEDMVCLIFRAEDIPADILGSIWAGWAERILWSSTCRLSCAWCFQEAQWPFLGSKVVLSPQEPFIQQSPLLEKQSWDPLILVDETDQSPRSCRCILLEHMTSRTDLYMGAKSPLQK